MTKRLITKTTLLGVLITVFCITVNAQKNPIKFGKIDIEELKMTVYDKDTSAEAVVLCDYGEFDPRNLQFLRHCRIKVLKKSGTGWATVQVRLPDKGFIKARTYNLENGEIVETKMKSESVYEERFKGDVYKIRFSLPNVKVGSIFEYSYYFTGIPYEWFFQWRIPVLWSELVMPQSQFITYQKNYFGYEPLHIVEKERWVAKDMPAFRSEPYMSSIYNYITSFEFEKSQVSIPSRAYYKEYTTSWDKVGEVLMKDEDFGQKITGNLFLNKFASAIKEKNISDYEKAKEAFELVKKEVKWDKYNSLWAYTPLLTVFNEKKGNSAEINLMLVTLLKKMDMKVSPVVLSTRENGVLSPFLPSINKLDYVVAALEIDGKTYYLDATDKHLPFGVLPKKCINGDAKKVSQELTQNVNLTSVIGAKEFINANLSLGNDGVITGKISNSYMDYAAYDFRKELDEYTNADEFIKDMQEDYNGLQIESYRIENLDSLYKNVIFEYELELDNHIDKIGNNIYINPMLLEKMVSNPFKSLERKYPVDYIHPFSKRYILSLTIPEGYAIEKVPESKKVSLPGNKASFVYQITSKGNNIQFLFTLSVNDPLVVSTEYLLLKEFYDNMVNKHSEMIILKAI